jgi:hypothetical protein
MDYARLTVAELHEDLCEELSDLVLNAGKVALEPVLDRLEADDVWSTVRLNEDLAPEDLVVPMIALREALATDPYLVTVEAQRLLTQLTEAFETLAKRGPANP